MKFKPYLLAFVLFVALIAIFYNQICDYLIDNFVEYDKDIDRNTSQLIESRGFKAEDHYVETKDGYILLVTRIVNPYVKEKKSLQPIVLQHGWMSNANTWIINSMARLDRNGHYIEDNDSGSVGNNLGFVLAINGFDVWLSNMRGTPYSLNHSKWSAKDPEYWRFSIDEMVEYDLPAVIAYVLRATGKEELSYIGYSFGTLDMLSLLASQPQYSQIVKPFIALAPLFYMENAYQIGPGFKYSQWLYKYLQVTDAPYGQLTKFMSNFGKMCHLNRFCFKLINFMMGFTESQCNMTRLGVYMSNVALGSSSWTGAQMLQQSRLGGTKKFDFGDPQKNLNKYNSSQPPDYELSAVNSTNIALIYTERDMYSELRDIERLKKDLKVQLLDDYLVPVRTWGHVEPVWGIDAGKYVNTRILDILCRTAECNRSE